MNFAYVLVSDSTDIYYEQFLVSLISLKHWNPDSTVFLAIDEVTAQTLNGLRSRHTKYVDEIKIVPFSADKGKHYRSRYLKTTLRDLFVGDFLYLDSDTIVCEKIEISEFTSDIMGVDDRHQLLENHSMKNWIADVIKKAGFSENGISHYVNGGVLWMKDSQKTHDFCAQWHLLWKKNVENGVLIDQPSLNEANKMLGDCIGNLSGIYNCQIAATLKYLYKAKIIHCFATAVSNREMPESAFYFLNRKIYCEIKDRNVTSADEEMIFNAKSAFDGRETILLGKKNSDIYRNLSRTNLYGFIYCLFISQRGRWLFNLMDKVVYLVTSIFRREKP